MQNGRQILTQQQKLFLSQKMIQSLNLMTLPFAELRERILEETEKNPALEIISDPVVSGEIPRHPPFIPESSNMTGKTSAVTAAEKSEANRNFLEKALSLRETLQDHLMKGLAETTVGTEVEQVAALVIQNLDSNGFHISPPETLSTDGNQEILEKAIKAVQKLDPIGCATSDFRESLAVQAEIYASFSKNPEEQRQYNLLSRILREHFSCFEKGRTEVFIRNLKKESGIQISLEEGKSLLELLRTLTPFPGRAFPSGQTLGDFTGDGAQYIVPDIFVKKEGEEFSIRINDEEIPVIGISPFFMKLGKDSGQGKQTRDFARESLQEARWFMNSLKKRNLTVMKVARVIVLFQKDFFNKGPKFLHPMKLKDVADETGLHEATVSRAASGKYLQCEWGIFELRYFFSGKAGTPSSLNKDGGTSKQSAKEIIREIIENSPGKPTDREIMELLSQKGINIARRTVAKYRNELSIGSSFDR